MTREELIARNRKFAVSVLKLIEILPTNRTYDALARQLVRCATSVGANYRAACRGKSHADFLNKIKIVEEEADESLYFLDLIMEVENGKYKSVIQPIFDEANQLVSIYVATLKTLRNKEISPKTNRTS
jgi:four helix bundle protein